MEIQVNGEKQTIEPGCKAADLLAQLKLAPERVVVERNREVIPRTQLAQVELKAGDCLEILHFVGGG